MARIIITEGDEKTFLDIAHVLNDAGYETNVSEAERTIDVADSSVSFDGLTIDKAAHEVRLGDETLCLTLSEYRILELLLQNRGRVLSRQEIILRISGGGKKVSNRSIDVQLVSLRRKLGTWAAHVVTIRGIGYRLDQHQRRPN